ncbi:MAG: GNAT family N-acetyltransferase [Agathobaculum sp.]|uniref:GNAT family N-acetyltransferase n=1 Tax=Agathobaculum sp. TaxID=2048138 RepID=UPI003D92F60B
MIARLTQPACAAALLAGLEQPMLWSYLAGRMGEAFADDAVQPQAVLVRVGDFRFLAGAPSAALVDFLAAEQAAFSIAVPCAPGWSVLIASRCPQAQPVTRYAFEKRRAFEPDRLRRFVSALPAGYTLRRMDQPLHQAAASRDWSRDLVSQYPSFSDYRMHGAGFAALYGAELVCGASSYADWPGGIEIEIDCHPAHRRKGLARACAAALILDCLSRGLLPCWDAANPVSAHLAQTLGFVPAGPYTAYEMKQ